jgi:tetratricopeptide (TPR) repeat protein
VSAQLTDVGSGYQVWAETYDRQFSDIFSIEENLAQALVVALSIPLALGEGPIAIAGTDNVEAYNLSLEGRYLFRSPTQENFTRALQLFSKAIELDPDFWSAHGYLAYCLGYASIYTSYAQQVVDASISIELALRNDPQNVPALLIKGFMLRNPDAAYPFYQRALAEGRERDLALYTWHNDYLVPQLRSVEARDLLLTGLEDDPDSILILQPLAMLESRAGNYARALELVSKVGKTDGSNFLVSSVLGDVYYRMKDAARLKKVSEDSIARIGHQNGFMTQYLIQALIMNEESDAAQEVIDMAIAWRDDGKPFSATTIGLGLAGLGQTREAASWLVQAERERDFWLRWHLKSALRDFPALAAEPVMVQLLSRMGLDDASIEERKAKGH